MDALHQCSVLHIILAWMVRASLRNTAAVKSFKFKFHGWQQDARNLSCAALIVMSERPGR